MAVRNRLLTIYNCGTSSNRDKGTSLTPGTAGELVAHLYDQTSAPDIHNYGRLDLPSYNFKLIHDGPGSAPAAFGKWEQDAQGVRKAVQHPASDSKAVAPGSGLFSHLPSILQQGLGVATGHGWEANVAHAVNVVKALKHRPDAINLAGWSRGAITCHMIANALNTDPDRSLAQIPVNIFAVDPVPGGLFGRHGKDKIDVAGNLGQYRGVFAMHDRKVGFQAAVITRKDEKDRDILFYPMPGVHCTVVSGATGLIAVAALVEHLAVEFLESNGTSFTGNVIHMTPHEICENYAIARRDMKHYEALAGPGLVAGMVRGAKKGLGVKGIPDKPAALDLAIGLGGSAPARRPFPGGVPHDPRPHAFNDLRQAYFVNQHHQETFSVAFPQAYGALFSPRQLEAAVTPSERQGWYEFRVMKQRYRNSYRELVKAAGGTPDEDPVIISS